jgi:hypothetical protein
MLYLERDVVEVSEIFAGSDHAMEAIVEWTL